MQIKFIGKIPPEPGLRRQTVAVAAAPLAEVDAAGGVAAAADVAVKILMQQTI